MAPVRWSARSILVGAFLTASLVGLPFDAAVASQPAGAATIQAGYDLFETDPGSTSFTFAQPDTAIPPNFFDPGSLPFTGIVPFGGVPIGTFMSKDVGDADTIVHRLQPAGVPGSVPIELVSLSLVSISPITVNYSNHSELWNVAAAPSQTAQSQGVLNISGSSAGGTFNVQIKVLPLLTFTRLSDGAMRQFDAAGLSATSKNKLILSGNNVPWQPGCTQPALAVAGLNDGFCASFTPQHRKKDTHLTAQLLTHDILPAQNRLEHFVCYSVVSQPFQARTATLTDQFGTRTATIDARSELCNPAKKNSEPFVNRQAHHQCYATTGTALNKSVTVQNQFGSQGLLVGKPVRLCLPTRKRLLSQPTLPAISIMIDHMQCYAVKPQTPVRAVTPTTSVTVKDEFGQRVVQIGPAYRLCAPVRKKYNNKTTPMLHPVRHLVCYQIGQTQVVKGVEILNQFERLKLKTANTKALCVPSNKIVNS
jgi:hypothetical protein